MIILLETSFLPGVKIFLFPSFTVGYGSGLCSELPMPVLALPDKSLHIIKDNALPHPKTQQIFNVPIKISSFLRSHSICLRRTPRLPMPLLESGQLSWTGHIRCGCTANCIISFGHHIFIIQPKIVLVLFVKRYIKS